MLVKPIEQAAESLIESKGARLVNHAKSVLEGEDEHFTMSVVEIGGAHLDVDQRAGIAACVKLFEYVLAIAGQLGEELERRREPVVTGQRYQPRQHRVFGKET